MYVLVTHAEDKRLRAVRGPLALVVELPRVPHDLEEQLRNLDRMSGWAWGSRLEGAANGIRDVALVVRAVQVDAVPAPFGLVSP